MTKESFPSRIAPKVTYICCSVAAFAISVAHFFTVWSKIISFTFWLKVNIYVNSYIYWWNLWNVIKQQGQYERYLPHSLFLGSRCHNHLNMSHWCDDIALTPDNVHKAWNNFLHRNYCHRLYGTRQKITFLNQHDKILKLFYFFNIHLTSLQLIQWFSIAMLIICEDIDVYLNPAVLF